MAEKPKFFEIKMNVLKKIDDNDTTRYGVSTYLRDFSDISAHVFDNREATKTYLTESVFVHGKEGVKLKFISRMKYDKKFVGETLFGFLMLENISGKTLTTVSASLDMLQEFFALPARKESRPLVTRAVETLAAQQIALLPFCCYLEEASHKST